MPYHLRAAAAASMLLVLSACGGGGDEPTASVKSSPDSVTVSGVAATGLALDKATVSAKCATGSGSTVTDINGSYTLTFEGKLPCLVEATRGGVLLYSIATNSTAQISPLTTLLVAHLLGKDPVTYFASVTAGPLLADQLKEAAIAEAQRAVETLTADAGIAGVPNDVLHAALVPATSGTAGNTHDKALDRLQEKLSAGRSTLVELSLRVANAAMHQRQPSSSPATDFTASLPANLLLRQANPSCAALRVGDYHVIGIRPTAPATPLTPAATKVMSISWTGAQMTVNYKDEAGTTAVLTPRPGAQCVFATPSGYTFIVAPSGLIVMAVPPTPAMPATFHTAIALPVQNVAVSELAGQWNLYGSAAAEDETGLHLVQIPAAQVAFNADGTVVDAEDPSFRVTAHSQGGFDIRGDVGTENEYRDRLFAYRAGSGHLMLLSINALGDLVLATPSGYLPLQAVGSSAVTWDMPISAKNAFYASGPFGSQYTVKSAAANAMVRTYQSITVLDGLAKLADPFEVTLQFNSPLDGYLQRQGSINAVRTVYPAETLPLKGMGLAYSYVTGMPEASEHYFALTVTAPIVIDAFK